MWKLPGAFFYFQCLAPDSHTEKALICVSIVTFSSFSFPFRLIKWFSSKKVLTCSNESRKQQRSTFSGGNERFSDDLCLWMKSKANIDPYACIERPNNPPTLAPSRKDIKIYFPICFRDNSSHLLKCFTPLSLLFNFRYSSPLLAPPTLLHK